MLPWTPGWFPRRVPLPPDAGRGAGCLAADDPLHGQPAESNGWRSRVLMAGSATLSTSWVLPPPIRSQIISMIWIYKALSIFPLKTVNGWGQYQIYNTLSRPMSRAS